jgi:hypothetical protein
VRQTIAADRQPFGDPDSEDRRARTDHDIVLGDPATRVLLGESADAMISNRLAPDGYASPRANACLLLRLFDGSGQP